MDGGIDPEAVFQVAAAARDVVGGNAVGNHGGEDALENADMVTRIMSLQQQQQQQQVQGGAGAGAGNAVVVAGTLGQSYRARAVRDRALVRRFSVNDDGAQLNPQALQAIRRVRDKLTGHDFRTTEGLDVVDQVEMLFRSAMAHENLCVLFQGWVAPW